MKAIDRGHPRRVPAALAVTSLLVSAYATFGCASITNNGADDDTDGAADRAQTVMFRYPGLSAGQRIGSVVGTVNNPARTIEALEAKGAARGDGTIVLRIESTLSGSGSFGTDEHALHCYRYTIQAGFPAGGPRRISCPDGPVVARPRRRLSRGCRIWATDNPIWGIRLNRAMDVKSWAGDGQP